jgi:hypothetical protein
VDRRDALTVVLLLLLIAFLLLVVRQQGSARAPTQVDEAGAAATAGTAQAAVRTATSGPTVHPSPTTVIPVAVVPAVQVAAAVAAPTATGSPPTATTAPPVPTSAPATATAVPATATAVPATATDVPLPTVPIVRPELRPTATAERAYAVRTVPTMRPALPVATRTPTAPPNKSAQPSASPEAPTATPTVAATPAAIEAVQVSRSQVSAGDGQAVVVVAPAGTPITITVTYPSHIVATYRGTAGADGVFRAPFTIPANGGVGPARVRVVARGESSSASFVIS